MRFNKSALEEKKDKQMLTLAILGSVALLVIVIVFGVNILTAFSLGLEKFRGDSGKDTDITTADLLAPTLFPVEEATKSANLKISGRATVDNKVIIYVNDLEFTRVHVASGGAFSEPIGNALKEGKNTISAKLLDAKGKTSGFSNVVTVEIKTKPPKLELANMEDNQKIVSDNNMLEITGLTDEDSRITINDRFVLVKPDGNFTYQFKMNEGDNIITIVATDRAGNTTTLTRSVTYQK